MDADDIRSAEDFDDALLHRTPEIDAFPILPEADRVLERKPAYLLNQFKPIARFSADPTVLVVRADAPWKTLAEFLADVKSQPGKYNSGNSGNSGNYGTMHVPRAMLESNVGVRMAHVPYTGAGPAIVARPGVPSLTQAGDPVRFAQWSELFVPSATPEPVVQRLRAAAAKVAADPAVRQVVAKAGSPIEYLDAPEFQACWDADASLMTQAVRRIGKFERAAPRRITTPARPSRTRPDP